MNEVNIFQSLIWLVLIALNAFFIWKYFHLSKAFSTQNPIIQLNPEKKAEPKKSVPTLNNFELNELTEIIEDIKKEEEITKNNSIQRLMYFAKYVVDPIIKNLNLDSNMDSKRIKKQIKPILIENYPNLSEQEILLCTYIANGISTVEIGHLLKLSNGTVRVYKNKLKMKLNVPKGLSLSKHLDSITELTYTNKESSTFDLR
jgi:DNA-binding CsgD family transcriptional regulator